MDNSLSLTKEQFIKAAEQADTILMEAEYGETYTMYWCEKDQKFRAESSWNVSLPLDAIEQATYDSAKGVYILGTDFQQDPVRMWLYRTESIKPNIS